MRVTRSVGPHVAAQPVGDLDQQVVAVTVAERVVDELEPVEVQVQQGDVRRVDRGAAEKAGQVFLHHPAVGQPGEAVVVRLMDQPGLRRSAVRSACTRRSHGRRRHGEHEPAEHDPLGERAAPVLEREDGRDEQGDRDEGDAEAGGERSSLPPGLGEPAHRRVQRAGAGAQVGEHVRQVEQPRGDAGEPKIGEEVGDVADEHERHAGEQQPHRRHPLPVGIEDDAQRHHHHEDRHRRVGDHDQRDGERHGRSAGARAG